MLILLPGRAQTEQPRRLDPRGHIRQFELDGLMLHDLLAKRLALL